jgi:hypothetical protein
MPRDAAGRFYVPKSRDHSDHGKRLAGPPTPAGLALDAGDGVRRSHESLDETRAVVHLDRRRLGCDYGSGGDGLPHRLMARTAGLSGAQQDAGAASNTTRPYPPSNT